MDLGLSSERLREGGKPSATNSVTGQLGILEAGMVCRRLSREGPLRDPEHAEPAAELGLGALLTASPPPAQARRSPGTPGWAFEGGRAEEQECRIRRNGETKAKQVPQPAEEKENLWALTFLAGEGLGQGGGRVVFIELEAARNLTICDVRSEVSCQEEDRSRDPLLGLQLGSREAQGIPRTPAPIPTHVCGSCVI